MSIIFQVLFPKLKHIKIISDIFVIYIKKYSLIHVEINIFTLFRHYTISIIHQKSYDAIDIVLVQRIIFTELNINKFR